MNIKDELINRVTVFLNKNDRQYYEGSIRYSGVREDMLQIDGSIKSMFVVTYMVSISNQQYDGDAFYSVFFDQKTLKMEYILGPQSFEKITE
jgi:hypothetical protein